MLVFFHGDKDLWQGKKQNKETKRKTATTTKTTTTKKQNTFILPDRNKYWVTGNFTTRMIATSLKTTRNFFNSENLSTVPKASILLLFFPFILHFLLLFYTFLMYQKGDYEICIKSHLSKNYVLFTFLYGNSWCFHCIIVLYPENFLNKRRVF